MFDVAVVGAGPAGACAAFELARQGLGVVLIEKMELPRYKTCGGGLVRRAQKLLPIDLAAVAERELTCASMHFLDSGVSFRAVREQPVITMVMRAALDHALVRHAEKAGAEIAVNTKVRSLTRTESCVQLETTRGTFAARFVIGADGVHSAVAKAAGWPDQRHLAPALEWEIQVPEEDFKRYQGSARFDFDLPIHGYGWVFPKRAHLSVGVCTLKRRDPRLGPALERYLRTLGLHRILHEQRHGFLIPVSARAASLARDRVLLVGDAAGLADPLTAEGISHAIRSGQLAAEALRTTQFVAGAAEARYDSLVREQLYPELRAARWLARLLYGSPPLRRWLFRRYGPQLVNAVTDIFTGDRTYCGMLKDWRNYLKLAGRSPGLRR